MSEQKNTKIVQMAYECFGRGDIPSILKPVERGSLQSGDFTEEEQKSSTSSVPTLRRSLVGGRTGSPDSRGNTCVSGLGLPAQALGLSVDTIKGYLGSTYRKVGVEGKRELVAKIFTQIPLLQNKKSADFVATQS